MAKRVGSAWPSCFRSALAFRLCFGLLLSVLISCGSPNQTMNQQSGPLVRIHVYPAGLETLLSILRVSAPDPLGTQRDFKTTFTAGPFDLIGVSFPVGNRGQASFAVELYGLNNCHLANGMALVNLDSDGVVDINLQVISVPLCGNGAVLNVQVANIGLGSGTVTSMPNGISCDGLGNGCSVMVMEGY